MFFVVGSSHGPGIGFMAVVRYMDFLFEMCHEV